MGKSNEWTQTHKKKAKINIKIMIKRERTQETELRKE